MGKKPPCFFKRHAWLLKGLWPVKAGGTEMDNRNVLSNVNTDSKPVQCV